VAAIAKKEAEDKEIARVAAIAKKEAEDKEIARLAAIAKKEAEDKEIARVAAIAKKEAEDKEIARVAAIAKKNARTLNMAKETEERCLIAFRQACIARRDAASKESEVRSLAENAVHLAALAKKNAEEKERDAERRSAAASALVAVSPGNSQKSVVIGEGSTSSEKSTDVAVELRRLASNSVSVARAEREDSEEKEKEAVRLAAMAVKLAQSTLSEAEENKKEKRKVVLLVRPESQARLTKILDEIAAQFEVAEAEVKAKEQQIAARGGSIAFSDNGVIQGGPRKIASASASANKRTLQISRRDSIPVPTQASIETVSSKSRSNSPVRPQGKGCAVRLTSVDGGRYPAEKRSFFNMFCTVPCFFLYSPLKRTHETHKNHSLIYSTEEVLFDKDTESIFENNQVTTAQCIALTREF
jgi:hypothetical protein